MVADTQESYHTCVQALGGVNCARARARILVCRMFQKRATRILR